MSRERGKAIDRNNDTKLQIQLLITTDVKLSFLIGKFLSDPSCILCTILKAFLHVARYVNLQIITDNISELTNYEAL